MDDSDLHHRYQGFGERFFALELKAADFQGGVEVLPQLRELIDSGRELLGSGLSPEEEKIVRSKIADAQERLAFSHLYLGQFIDARAAFEEAILGYKELGDSAAIDKCCHQIEFLERTASGDLDSDVEELTRELEETPSGSFEHCELLVRTAQLYQGIGDDSEAYARLQAALAELSELGIAPPSAEDLREALERDLVRYASPSLEELGGERRGLRLEATLSTFCEIYTALAFLCRRQDPQEAGRYAARTEELLARGVDWETARRLVKETREKQKQETEEELAGLPSILKPGGMASWTAEDLAFPDDELRNQLLALDRQMEENNRRLWEEHRAARERRDQIFEENLSRELFDPARARLELALLTVQNVIRRPEESREDLLRRAEELERQTRQVQNPPLLSQSLLRRSEILLKLDREEETLGLLAEAEKLLTDFEPHEQAVPILCTQAEIHGHRHDWEKTSAVCARGIALVERYRFKVTPPYLQTFYLRSRLVLYALGARAAREIGQVETMLERADLSKGRAILGYAGMAESSGPEIEETEKEFRRISEKIDAAIAAGESPSLLISKRRPIWERLFIQRAHHRANAAGKLSLSAVQSRLAPDEGILYFYWLDKETLLLVAIDQTRVHHELRALSVQHASDLERLSRPRPAGARAKRSGRELDAGQPHLGGLEESLDRLSSFLLPGVDWLAEKRRLIVSPHRLLHGVPFQALRWQGNFLIRHFAMSYVPNLGSLLLQHESAVAARVLAVGTCNSKVLPIPLQKAEEEVLAIEEVYRERGIPVTLLQGEEASKKRLVDLETSGLKGFSCLHFATHGSEVAEDAPMESRLFLHEAVLDGIEISSWQLQADLVVLSACWSAQRPTTAPGMKEVPGDEVLGLQGAFFAAGARRILGALWPVDDQTACETMVRFHRELSAGRPPEVALQQAILAHLDTTSSPDVRDWAPFLLVCLGRAAV